MSLRVSRDFYHIQSLRRSLEDLNGHSDMIAGNSIVMATVGRSTLQILTFMVGFTVGVEFRATWVQCYGENGLISTHKHTHT